MATHSSILTWKIPWAAYSGRLHVCGLAKSRTWVSNRAGVDLLLSVAPRMPDGFLKRQCSTLSFRKTLWVCASGRAFFHTLAPSSATASYCWLLDARFMWPQEILDSPVSACFLISLLKVISSVQSLSHVQLCDPKDCSMPAFPVHHQLLKLTQTHVHWADDAIQPSHPLSSPSPPAPNPSQHQGLFQWVSSLHEVAKVLEFQLQHQSFQWTPRTDLL